MLEKKKEKKIVVNVIMANGSVQSIVLLYKINEWAKGN